MAFDLTGKLHVAYETKQVSERFTKREFVVEVADGKYPQYVLFQLTGDRCSQLDDHKVGDAIQVTFNLRGREWRSPQGETKYFNSLDVWRIEPARAGAGRHTNNGNGRRQPQGDPRGDVPVIPRDFEVRPGDAEPAVDDIPF